MNKQDNKAEWLYGDDESTFKYLREISSFRVYTAHIVGLQVNLAKVTADGEYDRAYDIQKAISFWESMITQIKE